MIPTDHDRCVSCDEPLHGRYCHACGEKRPDARDLTLAAFGRYAIASITNADAKLYLTMRRLVGAPGVLTRDFVAGRRRPYIGPLRLFLLVNVVYFLLVQVGWGTRAFNTDLVYHRTQPVYGPVADRMMQDRLGTWPEREEGQTVQRWMGTWSEDQLDYRQRFNDASPRYASSLVLLMVPLFALALRVLRRRSLMVRELVLSTHFFAFLLLLLVVLPLPFLLLYLAAPGLMEPLMRTELGLGIPLIALLVLYLASAFRTAHGDRWPAAVARAVPAVLLLFAVVTVYRMALFFVVFLAVQ
jgi:hypothetical protein